MTTMQRKKEERKNRQQPWEGRGRASGEKFQQNKKSTPTEEKTKGREGWHIGGHNETQVKERTVELKIRRERKETLHMAAKGKEAKTSTGQKTKSKLIASNQRDASERSKCGK